MDAGVLGAGRKPRRAAELFCGMGMSSIGVVRSGADLQLGVEINPRAVTAFNLQTILPPVAVEGSVGEVPLPNKLDILSGGPVCKPFSPGATVFGTKGAEDDRNTFPLMMRDIEISEPDYVFMENTIGLQRFAGYLTELIETLQDFGYNTSVSEVDVFDFGVPQHRRRLVFLATRKRKKWILPELPRRLDGPETVGDCLYDVPASDPWPLISPLTEGSRDYYLRDPIRIKKHRPLTPDRPAPTITATYAKGVPYGVVQLGEDLYNCGPRLAARLQGLPDEYDLSMLSKTAALQAIGNGFSHQVVQYCLETIP